MPELTVGDPEETQRSLARLNGPELAALLADVSIAVALKRDDGPTPQRVLREALDSFGWDESAWPDVRAEVMSWIEAPGA